MLMLKKKKTIINQMASEKPNIFSRWDPGVTFFMGVVITERVELQCVRSLSSVEELPDNNAGLSLLCNSNMQVLKICQ